MLRIITGRSSSGKSDTMLDMMRDSSNSIYIVPEQYSFAAEKKITHAFGMSGMGYPSVYSFRRLAHYMEELYGKEQKESLNGVGRVMVLSDIVKKLASELTLFGGAARRGEMANEASVIITTFKQYNVTGTKLSEAIEKTKNPLLKKKLLDCMKISEAYEKFLEDGYSDEDDLLITLKDRIEKEEFFCGKDVYIDSFSAFTPLEYSVIGEILKKAGSVTVALCASGDGDEFVIAKNSAEKLKRLCEKTGVKFGGTIETEGAMYTATDEMKSLEKSFFDEDEVFGDKTDKVSIYKADDEYHEVVGAAREIERLCRDEEYRYRDIVIVMRDYADYEKHISRVFDSFDIPVFMDKKTPLSSESAAVFALSAIRIISNGWRNADVFSYMKAPFSPIDAISACELENYCLASLVRARDWRSDKKWDMPLSIKDDKADDEYLERINKSREQISEPLRCLEAKIKGKHTGREFCIAFYEFMESCGLEEKIDKISESIARNGDGEQAMRTRQVYDLLIGILECFDDAFGAKKLGGDEFLEILTKGIENVEIGSIPPLADSVCVGNIDRARGHGAKACIVMGCSEGVFPAAVKDEGIFTNADRRELEEYGIELPADTLGKAYMEESLVYSALTCATERIFVSYSAGGEDARASSIVKRIERVFPKCIVRDSTKEEDAFFSISSAKSTYEDFAVAFARENAGEDVGDEWYTVFEYYKNSPLWKDKVEEIEKHISYENKSELIRSEIIRARYGEGINTSVSRLERYSKCPFSYFASVTLGLKERQELEVTRADGGSFLHEFVDLFGKSLKEDGKGWRDVDSEYIDKKTEEIALGLMKGLNKHLLETSPAALSLFVKLKRIAKRSVTALCEHMKKGQFEPLGYEIEFDVKGKFKPLTIVLPNGQKAKLRGRIDRADILETKRGNFVRIIDYKSGEKKFSINNIYQGFDLQLVMYLTTLCENGGYRPAGMLYFKIDDPVVECSPESSDAVVENEIMKQLKMDGLVLEDDEILSAMDRLYASGSDVIPVKKNAKGEFTSYSKVATEGEFAALSKHAKQTVKKLCSEILNGRSEISPVRGACMYCEMKPLCGFDVSVKGCSYRRVDKLNDKEALEEIMRNE